MCGQERANDPMTSCLNAALLLYCGYSYPPTMNRQLQYKGEKSESKLSTAKWIMRITLHRIALPMQFFPLMRPVAYSLAGMACTTLVDLT